MARSSLFGRRIHIAGSVVEDVAVASADDVSAARDLVASLVRELVNLALCPESTGARRIYNFGLTSSQSRRLFQIADDGDAHAWINRIRFPPRQPTADRVAALVDLLEALERPKAFAIRLLNPGLTDYKDVQDFFDVVVQPVIENELGYRLVVVDGRQP